MTIDTIKVVETIKQGVTIFALRPEQQRKAELMVRPGRSGENAFARAMRVAAHHRASAAPGADHHGEAASRRGGHASGDEECCLGDFFAEFMGNACERRTASHALRPRLRLRLSAAGRRRRSPVGRRHDPAAEAFLTRA